MIDFQLSSPSCTLCPTDPHILTSLAWVTWTSTSLLSAAPLQRCSLQPPLILKCIADSLCVFSTSFILLKDRFSSLCLSHGVWSSVLHLFHVIAWFPCLCLCCSSNPFLLLPDRLSVAHLSFWVSLKVWILHKAFPRQHPWDFFLCWTSVALPE